MKKYIIKTVIAVFLLTGISGCTDWLDLKPESEIILDDFWQSESDVQSVIASCYRGLTEDAVIYRMMVWGELRSDNLTEGAGIASSRYDMRRILEGDLLSSNAYSSWGAFYSVINYCNTILKYAPDVVNRDFNFTQSDLHKAQAEALTIRALCYFYLVRSFKEVPWIEEASINDSQDYNKPKNTEEFILNRIIEDLKTAQNYAVTDYGKLSYNKGRITLDAVNSLLADVYLWKGDYDNCVKSCDLVLANKKLKLEPANFMFNRVFYNGNSNESIFELQFNDNVQRNNPTATLYGKTGNPYGELSFPATLAYNPTENETGAFSPFNYKISSTVIESQNDIRAKESYTIYGGKFFIFKYAGIARLENVAGGGIYLYRTNTSNWIVYRLSDIMLMKAEALVQLDGTDNMKEAIELVNETYLRSNTQPADSLRLTNYTTQTAMSELVLRERQRELLFEGKRWFDLVRMARRGDGDIDALNNYIDHKSSGNTISLRVPVIDALFMPISRGELEANRNLKQNPYYEETTSTSTR